jgi:hypothetical protein
MHHPAELRIFTSEMSAVTDAMIALPTKKLFLKRCNTAWLLCSQPSTDHAMPTAAIIHSVWELS